MPKKIPFRVVLLFVECSIKQFDIELVKRNHFVESLDITSLNFDYLEKVSYCCRREH